MSDTESATGSPYLHDLNGAYALIIRNNNEVQMVSPTLKDGDPLTDGHLLLLGMITLLNRPGWAQTVVEQTAKYLSDAKAEIPAEG